jgi:hypothetical protein
LKPRNKFPQGPGRRCLAMESADHLLAQAEFDIARIHALRHRPPPPGNLLLCDITQELEVAPHKVVGDRHQLAEHLIRWLRDPNVVSQGLRHLLDTIQPFQDRHGDDDLGLLAIGFLKLPPDQKIKLLIGATELHVCPQGYRVIALDKGIKKLMDGDWLPRFEALGEIITLQHAATV